MTREELSASERQWLDVREYLVGHRYELGVDAVSEYPDSLRVDSSPLLTTRRWMPDGPLLLDSISIRLDPDADDVPVAATPSLPTRFSGVPYHSYSEAIRTLAAPRVFENRPTYRLLAADLAGPTPTMHFGRGSYFDGVDVGEAAAHEYASQQLGVGANRFRQAIGDPCDPTRRPTNVAISTLTLRRDVDGSMSFVLHWRDPRKVGHAGGLFHVIPTGIFQPSGDVANNERNDFSLWRNMVREFAEELAGRSEEYGGSIDYASWSFARRLDGARPYCLGMGVDPLTLATDLLTVVVIDGPLYDELFSGPTGDAEGDVLALQSFDESTVREYMHHRPMQAAGVALLALAWNQRGALK